MSERPDPTRRLSALRSTPATARTGWVPSPPDRPAPTRRRRGAHRLSAERTDLGDKSEKDDEDDEDDDEVPFNTDTDSDPDLPSLRRAVGGPWGRMAEKWVPDSLREARVDPGRRGAVLLTVVAAVAAVVAAVGVWRDRPETRPVQPVALAPATSGEAPGSTPYLQTLTDSSSGARASPAPGSPPPGSPEPTSSSVDSATESVKPASIYVSVTGLVRKPGLVRLRAGSRVADAIAAAGGVTDEGDVTGMNLAARLSDGDSVVVGGNPAGSIAGSVTGSVTGTRLGAASGPGSGSTAGTGTGTGSAGTGPAGTGPAGTGAAATPMNLNQADQAALESLPGVGPVMAGNILAWRVEHGSFTSVQQLQEITGIGPTRYAQLAPLVSV